MRSSSGCFLLLGSAVIAGCGDGEPDPPGFDPNRGYEARSVAPGSTTPEASSPTQAMPGSVTTVTLSDGTEVTLSAPSTLTGAEPVTTLTLARQSTEVDLGGELAPSGSTRTLTFEPFDPHARGAIAADFSPTIRFPAEELGELSPDTVFVARVVDVYDEDGAERQGVVQVLPAYVDEDGSVVAHDYLFPDSVMDAARAQAEGGRGGPGGVFTPNHIAYVAGTFQGSANWSMAPVLVRMTPARTADGLRVPGTQAPDWVVEHPELPRCESTVTPVLVLVHGHNEEEGAGFGHATSGPAPWFFAYKRDVWTRLYEQMLEAGEDAFVCARIYEFIYPTYRPIFTPSGSGRERLDEAFARLLQAELLPLVRGGNPIELTIVAHSMGGLVSRSAVQLVAPDLSDRLEHLLTWGTPHLGSPLVSLRYVLASPVPYALDHQQMNARASAVLGALGSSALVNEQAWRLARAAISNVQIDSPGTRDLRWARDLSRPPHALALDALFDTTSAHAADPTRWDLLRGSELYSDNTRLLVENDALLSRSPYTWLYGTTSKRVMVSGTGGRWYTPQVSASETALGATMLEWLVSDPMGGTSTHRWGESDGAAPFASMTSAGQAGTGLHAGDIDHEQYFAAEPAMGPDTGTQTALLTFDDVGMHEGASCPAIVAHVTSNDGRWGRVEGVVTFPGLADLPAANHAGGEGVLMVVDEDWNTGTMTVLASEVNPGPFAQIGGDGRFSGAFMHIMRRSTTTNRVFAARFTPPGGRNCVVVGRPGPYPPVPVFETSFDAPDLRVDPTPSVSTDWARADYHFEYRVESEDVRALPGSGCTSPSSCFEILDLIPDAPARITVTPTLSLEPAEYRFELSGNRYDLYRIESPVTVEPEIMVFGGGTATGAVSASGFVVDATMPEGGHAYIRMLTRATLVEEAHDGDAILTTTRTPFTFRGPYIELQGIHDP